MREPSKKAILKEFLKRGNLLIVDSFCCFFSWERRELFKSLIQDATNVKFQSKPANNFFAEFSGCFQNVTELTLSGFTVLNENLFNDLPGGLRRGSESCHFAFVVDQISEYPGNDSSGGK